MYKKDYFYRVAATMHPAWTNCDRQGAAPSAAFASGSTNGLPGVDGDPQTTKIGCFGTGVIKLSILGGFALQNALFGLVI